MTDRINEAFWKKKAKDRTFDQMTLAALMNVTPQAVSQWMNGEAEPAKKRLAQLAQILEVALDWLATGQASREEPPAFEQGYDLEGEKHGTRLIEDFVVVPRYEATAFQNGKILHSTQIVDYMAFKEDWLRSEFGIDPADLILVTARGDAMTPTIREGDLLLVDKSVDRAHIDSIYVLWMNNNDLLVKRLQVALDGTITVKNDNPTYEMQAIPPDRTDLLNILGRVLMTCKRS